MGSLYVAQSEMGSVLRKFTPEGRLAWELFGHVFVDLMCADPRTDGLDVWGIQEHYKMDYTKPPGKEAAWVGYSLDRHKYPDDPRGLTYVKQQGEHGLTSPQIVYLEGKRFLFAGGMFASNFINIFRYDAEMAIPSGLILQWDGGLLPHEPHLAARSSQRAFSLARQERRRPLPGRRVRAQHRPNQAGSVPGRPEREHLDGLRILPLRLPGAGCEGKPDLPAEKITLLEKPAGMKNGRPRLV